MSNTLRRNLLIGAMLSANLVSGCSASLMTKAAIANDKLAVAARQIQITIDAAHARDCDLQTPGLQRCLSDADFERAREIFIKAAQSGLAFNAAIKASDQAGAMTQADAAIGFIDQLLASGVVKLSADDQLIARTVLEAARVALAAVKGGAK